MSNDEQDLWACSMICAGYKQAYAEIKQLKQEIAQLRKLAEDRRVALEKCSPHHDGRRCIECDELFPDHTDNCEYVRLTK